MGVSFSFIEDRAGMCSMAHLFYGCYLNLVMGFKLKKMERYSLDWNLIWYRFGFWALFFNFFTTRYLSVKLDSLGWIRERGGKTGITCIAGVSGRQWRNTLRPSIILSLCLWHRSNRRKRKRKKKRKEGKREKQDGHRNWESHPRRSTFTLAPIPHCKERVWKSHWCLQRKTNRLDLLRQLRFSQEPYLFIYHAEQIHPCSLPHQNSRHFLSLDIVDIYWPNGPYNTGQHGFCSNDIRVMGNQVIKR